jgi:peroxiredoxin
MEALRDKEVVVLLFTCNSCPYAVDYEDRFREFGRRYAGAESRVAVVAINVNRIAADQLPAMKERAEQKGFVFPYLYDGSQSIAREYGAVRTPECFVLDRERRIVYMGAFDDSSKAAEVKVHYVQEAVDAQLSGAEIRTQETPPIGCRIRYVGERGK